MVNNINDFERYFSHLKRISFFGRLYKKFISSPIIFYCASRFGLRLVEVGSGTGSGVLGTFRKHVTGLDINPLAVEYCCSQGLIVKLIDNSGVFPISDHSMDACILDNVLEHLESPNTTLNECYRITKENGGLVIIVPGLCGYNSDNDHKKYYSEQDLRKLDERWTLIRIFSIPFIFKSLNLSKQVRQYCLIAIYKKDNT